jgi:PIN domain nuclease of toxin-antitoxin system
VTLLLDSNALYTWARGGRFDRGARRRVEREGATVSAVTAWELGHKQAIGKLRLPVSVREIVDMHDFGRLDVTFEHAEHATRLPMHHRDPFDRFLIAQAQVEGMTIVTRDEVFDAYDVDVLRC